MSEHKISITVNGREMSGYTEARLTLVDFLRRHYTKETFDGDNAYACDTCDQKTPATRSLYTEKFPPFLVIQII